jgi:wyosine [tRNA(Phe)-imidazoG37] synthetase (radical SAM superfamily)
MLLEPKTGIIYGPVRSRRLGRSLGINILPAKQKACPFDCVYCQYGWTDCYSSTIPPNLHVPDKNEFSRVLEKTLSEMNSPPVYITFSGNGEPTLHPDFDGMVDELIKIRNKFAPSAKTAILSNSALVSDKSIRQSLAKLDVRIMKLDCGSPQIFQRYNQPCSGIDLEKITQGLVELEDVIIQALFSSGETGNCVAENIEAWGERLTKIKPKTVQLYTLDRDFPDKRLRAATKNDLSRIKEWIKKAGLAAEIF